MSLILSKVGEEVTIKKITGNAETKKFLNSLGFIIGEGITIVSDLGGNLIQLTFNRDQTNLHSLWDTKLVDYQRYSYKEFAKVLDYKSKEEIQKIQSGTLENWLYDSYTKANRIYTQTKPNGVYSYDYNYKFSGLLEEQLLAGGLRLAKVLDEILQ